MLDLLLHITGNGYLYLTVDPFLSVQLQHTHFELEVSGDHLGQVDHKTMG